MFGQFASKNNTTPKKDNKPTSAIILSLGMLHDKVENNPFISTLLAKAKEADAEFKFTVEKQIQGFGLSEKLNVGEIDFAAFKQGLMKLLKISMEDDEFLKLWNAAITVGKASERIAALKQWATKNNAAVYLNSDTNFTHLEKIVDLLKGEKMFKDKEIKISLDQTPIMLDDTLPLYTTCQMKKNRIDIVKEICNQIKKNESTVEKITLILGDPENIVDKASKEMAKKETAKISEWCRQNQVSLCFYKDKSTLEQTLSQIEPSSVKANDVPQVKDDVMTSTAAFSKRK